MPCARRRGRQNTAWIDNIIEAFRMYKEWSTISFDTLFTLSTAVSTRGHSAKLMKNRYRLELRRHFFLGTSCQELEWSGPA